MLRGISTSKNLTNAAACLREGGLDFAFRYYSTTTHNPEKRLAPDEAAALSAAGLQLGVVYEDNPVNVGYFSGRRGHQDGVNAYHAALDMHQPAGSAIYFAVDYDAAPADISGPILDYFKGVDQGMRDAGSGVSSYSIGVYGSGATCDFVKTHCAFVKYSWLAESRGWRGSRTYAGWDVSQAIAATDLCQLGIDGYEENTAKDDFGAFSLSFEAAPSALTVARRRAK